MLFYARSHRAKQVKLPFTILTSFPYFIRLNTCIFYSEPQLFQTTPLDLGNRGKPIQLESKQPSPPPNWPCPLFRLNTNSEPLPLVVPFPVQAPQQHIEQQLSANSELSQETSLKFPELKNFPRDINSSDGQLFSSSHSNESIEESSDHGQPVASNQPASSTSLRYKSKILHAYNFDI